MNSLNEKILNLENEIKALKSKVEDLSRNTEETYKKPTSIVGGGRDRCQVRPIDISSGMGQMMGGSFVWNDTEAETPPYGIEPPIPDEKTGIGYNKHSHSRFSGGALIVDVLEFVEYDWKGIVNKHSQQYWNPQPKIATAQNSNEETVEKIGKLGLSFDADTLEWMAKTGEIDIKKTYLVEYDEDGNIAVDANGKQKKSVLWNEDTTKSALRWDESSEVWRFYAVYAPEPEV